MRYRLIALIFCLISSVSSHAFTLRPDAPARYVVQQGDTLWSIANRYLEHPWDWPLLWRANPSIKNPDKLFPGAVIECRGNHSHPYLRVLSNGTIKLSPTLRETPFEKPIPPIPLYDILPFLDSSLVLDQDALTNAPYVIGFKTGRLLGGQGDEVYVKNLCPNPHYPSGKTLPYALYRPNGEYWSLDTKQLLGYKATLVGYADLVRLGDPATVLLTDITQGVQLLDRVMPDTHPGFDINFEPKAPLRRVRGSIIDFLGDFTIGAEGLVAVLDQGQNLGLKPGDVLGLYTNAHRMTELECPFGCVTIPRERIGEVMVFRTFTHTSFALVVRATETVKLMDGVMNP